jgi:Secretion system C-terminal sorting domain
MKRSGLLLFVLFFSLVVQAQSTVRIVSPVYGLVNGQTIVRYIATGQEVDDSVHVSHTDSTALPIMKIRRTYEPIVGNSFFYFYTDSNSYGPTQNLTYPFVGIPGIGLMPYFIQSTTVCDTNRIRYTAFVVNNPADSAWVEFLYYCVDGLASVQSAPETTLFNAFPNPANNTVQLSFAALEQNTQIEIYNQLGERVESLQIAAFTTSVVVDVNRFADGVYLFRLVNSEGLLAQKPIVVIH